MLEKLLYFLEVFQKLKNEKWRLDSVYLSLVNFAWITYFWFSDIIAQKGLACKEFWIVAIVVSTTPIYYLTFLNELKILEKTQTFKEKVLSRAKITKNLMLGGLPI